MDCNEKLIERKISSLEEGLKFLCEKYKKIIRGGANGSASKPKVSLGDCDGDGMILDDGNVDEWNNPDQEDENLGYDDGDVDMKNEEDEEDDPWGLDGGDDDENEYKKIAQQNIQMEQMEIQKKMTQIGAGSSLLSNILNYKSIKLFEKSKFY